MAIEIGNVICNVKGKFSMWHAIKIRVSGVLKNAESFEQVGDVIKITYAKERQINK